MVSILIFPIKADDIISIKDSRRKALCDDFSIGFLPFEVGPQRIHCT